MTTANSDGRHSPVAGAPLRLSPRFSLRRSAAACTMLAASFALGGCTVLHDVRDWLSREQKPATSVAVKPVVPPPAPPPAQLPKPKPQPREQGKPDKPDKPEKLAELDPNTLIGLDPPTVEKLLGSPTRVTKSDISLVWTFSAPSCSFQVFFYPDLKTSAFHALKYGGVDGNGAQLAMSELCIRGILTAKTNAPG